jgi:xanthine/uracil/vitamin C permease (AzgA family)
MLNACFEFDTRRTSLKTEAMAGATTFLTMAYIIFVNPSILSLEGIEIEGVARMDKQGLVAATCVAAGVGTLAVGLVANAPIAMAPGMGLNAFFATLLISGRMSWQTALGAVFVSGAVFLVLTLLGLRRRLVGAIPASLVSAITVGIGLFMMKDVRKIDFDRFDEGFPAFVIMVMIALSYSISTGLAFGFISFAILKILSGKVRAVRPAMWVIACLSLAFLLMEYVPGVSERIAEFLVGPAAEPAQP